MDSVAPNLVLIFPALAILGGIYDAASMRIPNWISIVLAVCFVPVAFIAGMDWQTVLICVGMGLAALVIGIVLFALRILGGGDAKLLAASVIWCGLSGLLPFLIYVALAGGALSMFLLMARKWAPSLPFSNLPRWIDSLLEPKGDIPYGIAIALGAIAAYPQSELLKVAF